MGVRIAIDDFGAGHASLEYLRNFKFDILKLDRSLVADIETSQLDFMLTGSICRIASAIGVAVVAEGVETEAQRDALTALGCTHLQGFLLGRPAPLALPQVLRAEVA
jgi:EAL domain-containing protein (putative c-di-GMP-specific phosphodiesterase class I)